MLKTFCALVLIFWKTVLQISKIHRAKVEQAFENGKIAASAQLRNCSSVSGSQKQNISTHNTK